MPQPWGSAWGDGSSRQRRLNRRLEVFRGDAALEAGDHGAVLAHQELLEVPLHITGGIHLVEGGVGLGGAPLGVHLVEQFEVGAVGGGAEALDLVQGAGLLGAEVVAGETQHRQALGGVGLVQGLQTGVLLGEATAAGHVHDQQHLAGVVAQGFAAAVRGGDGDGADADRHGETGMERRG